MKVLLPVFAALIFVSVVLTSSRGELFYLSLSKDASVDPEQGMAEPVRQGREGQSFCLFW